MTISMYQASTPCFARMLRNLSTLIDKVEAHCTAKKIEPAALTTARLFPDMFPFTRQVQIACDIPKHEDTEQTFAELKARIAKTLDFIESVPAAKIDGSEEREIVLQMRSGERRFKGMQYLLGSAYPNFYFHVTPAYNILRHNGVEIGKTDFLGRP